MRRTAQLAASVAAVVLAACAPAPGSPTTTTSPAPTTTASPTTTTGAPGAPVISAFAAATPSGAAPLTTGFTWTISDPNADPLTCQIDLDGNGTTETLITGCTSSSIRTASFATAGTRTIRLDVSDGSTTTTATTTVTVGAASADAFAITLRFVGSMSSTQQDAFNNAAARWASLVKGGLPATSLSIPADDCLTGMPSFSGSIDDLMIDATITSIDGAGGILGSAGPCYVRSSGGLPLYGVMQFDSADVASLESSGRLEATILHEMGHVMGIGTLWTAPLFTGAGTSDPLFNGVAARGAWQSIGGTGSVPVENTGGAGTRDGHWREATFDNELMTGWLDSGSNPLSRMTVASLHDMGYAVDMTGADSYGLPGLRLFGLGNQALDIAHGERLITPRAAA